MSKFPPLKISTLLLISQFIISLIGVGSVSGFALISIEQSGRQAILRDAENLAYAISNGLEVPLAEMAVSADPPGPADFERIQSIIQDFLARHPDTNYVIYRPDGQVLLGNPSNLFPNLPQREVPAEIAAALAGGFGSAMRPGADGQTLLYAAARIDHGTEIFGIIQIETPYLPEMAPTRKRMLSTAALAAAIIAVMMLISWQSSRILSRPLGNLTRVAEKLSQGELSARAEQTGPLEITRMAETLNTMAERLHASLVAMQSFVANASHELRTPLTSIKLEVGALRAGAMDEPEVAERFLNQMDGEIDRLVYTVNEMLDLSQIESTSQAANFVPVDLVDLACEVQAFWEARSQQAGLELSLQYDANLPQIRGDAYQLRRVFDNLIDNAIKNTPSGGQVQIHLMIDTAQNRLRMEIHDTGIGIDSEHFAHIFDRFYRVNPAANDLHAELGAARRSSGSGLGLAIARSIILAHHGEIGVESHQGQGSTFWISLPVWTD